MADEFSQPLGQTRSRRRMRLKVDPLLVVAGLLVLAGSFLAGWVLIVEDPRGGEPVAVALIEQALAKPTSEMRGSDDAATAKVEEPLPDLETIARNIRIVDASAAPVSAVAEPAPAAVPPARSRDDGVLALSPAPDPRLAEASRFGSLPRVGEDGSRPADVYARPVVRVAGAGRARVVIVLTGLGLSERVTNEAVARLPGPVTLAFVPYGERAADLAAKARADGHETLLQLPMEPFDYPDSDAGPKSLLVSVSPVENIERARWAMGRLAGYAGVTSHMGGRLLSAEPVLKPVLEEVKARGLYFVDQGAAQSRAPQVAAVLGLQASRAELVLDGVSKAEAIDARLGELESLAQSQGTAIAVAAALPVTIERIARWTEGLGKRGVQIIPASAAIQRPNT